MQKSLRTDSDTDRRENSSVSRRSFLAGALGAAAFTVVPSNVIGANGQKPPGEKLNIAGIGIGNMGWNDLNNPAIKSENIVALCDVNEKHLARASKRFSKAETYIDWRRCLEQDDIDAVYCATPDQVHAFIVTWAMNRGYHVYCQKPLARTVEEAHVVRETYLKNRDKLATQMGTQMHAHPNVRRVIELVRGGAIGKPQEAWVWCSREPRDEVKKGHYFADKDPAPGHLDWDLWVGPSPYHPFNPKYLGGGCLKWNWFRDFGAGQIGDMGSHMMDIAHWALELDVPNTCEATGSPIKNDTCPFWLKATWEHPAKDWRPALKVHWCDGGKKPKDVPENDRFKGVVIKGEKGYMIADYGYRKIKLNNGETKKDDESIEKGLVPPTKGPDTHYQAWVDACKSGEETLSNFDYAGRLIQNNMLALAAYRSREKLQWDAENLKATNCPEAEKYIRRTCCPGPTYRKGWTLNG